MYTQWVPLGQIPSRLRGRRWAPGCWCGPYSQGANSLVGETDIIQQGKGRKLEAWPRGGSCLILSQSFRNTFLHASRRYNCYVTRFSRRLWNTLDCHFLRMSTQEWLSVHPVPNHKSAGREAGHSVEAGPAVTGQKPVVAPEWGSWGSLQGREPPGT